LTENPPSPGPVWSANIIIRSSDMVEGVVRIPEDWSDCLVKATQTAIDGTPYVFTLGVC
jgi:hypothetical protein